MECGRDAAMALINCPECNHEISDRAATCPNCGYPLQKEASPLDVLIGKRWVARSGTLVDGILDVTFEDEGKFAGAIRAADSAPAGGIQMVTPSDVTGTWVARGSELFLDFVLTMQGVASPTQIGVDFTEISDDQLRGVDQWARPWEMERVE
jgi:hypothetical protein